MHKNTPQKTEDNSWLNKTKNYLTQITKETFPENMA